jgi:SWI/SNF-related matrix-associated actin-dependent regulator of chromatin subfamily A-like protein 1
MGVGKTIQALAVSYLFKSDWPLLVICPASLKFTWRDEVVKWIPSLEEGDVQIIEYGKEKFNQNCCVFVMSYDLAAKRS